MLSDLSKNNYFLYSQCKRGMLELDEVLIKFLDNNYKNLNQEEQQAFKLLLEQEDAILFSWIFNNKEPNNEIFKKLIRMIKN